MPAVGTVGVSSGSDTKVVNGLYLLKLNSVTDEGISQLYPDSGPQWLWKWEVVRSLEADPDDEQLEAVGEVIYDYTKAWIGYTKAGARSKALERIDACLNVVTPMPEGDEEIETPIDDTEELIGKGIKASVTVAPNKAGTLRAKLTMIAPYKSKKQAKPAAKPAAPPPDDEDDDDDLPF